MAVSKQYTITIQMDAAQQTLDAAIKKLNKLDQSLEGIDADSKAGQAIVADMAKAAKAVEAAQAQVDKFSAGLDALVPVSAGTYEALNQDVKRLRSELLGMTEGSAEAAAAIQRIAAKKSELRGLANQMNALNPEIQARAFTAFSGALVGATCIAQTAATVFGLNSDTAEKWAAKMQGLVGVLYSVEQISKLLNGENLALGKSIISGAKAWLGFGEAAKQGTKAVKIGLAETGIGLIVLAVGMLVGLWMEFGSVVGSSESKFTKFKAAVVGGFDAMIELVKDYYKILYQVATLDFSGAINTFKNAGKDAEKAYRDGAAEVVADAHRKEIGAQLNQNDRLIGILKAKGQDVEQLEIEQAIARANNMKRSNDEEKKAYQDAVGKIAEMKAATQKKQYDTEKAQTLARLNGLAAIEAAGGHQNFEQAMAAKREQQQQQLDADLLAGRNGSAAMTQLLAEMQAMQDAHDKDVREKKQAAELASLDARISLQQAKGREAFDLTIAREEKELAFLKSAADQNAAAIIAQQSKIANLRATHEREETEKRHAQRLAELDAVISLENTKGQESYADQMKREELALTYLQKAGTKNLAAITAQQSKIANLKAAHAVKEATEAHAADLARSNAEIALETARGNNTVALQLQLKGKELAALLTAATQNGAAIIAKQGEIDALQEQQRVQAEEKRRAREIEDFENEMTLKEKQGKDVLALRIAYAKKQLAADTDASEKGLAKRRQDMQKLKELETEMGQRKADLGNYLLKLLGVSDEDLPIVKERINQAMATLSQSVGSVVDSMLTEGMSAADAAIQDAQTRLSELDKQLSDVRNKRQADEQALATATGARRDYLLGKINKEKAAEQQLAAQKAKAAADEEQAKKARAKLDKEQQQISAASTAIESVLLAIKAAQAVVDASDKGKFGYDNIALAIAAAAAIGAGMFAVKNAAKTFETGGLLHGPTHKQGGIPFTIGGRPGFEAEGGEFIVNRTSTARHLPLLQMINEASNVRVLPHPNGHFAIGGQVPSSGSLPPGTIAVQAADLSEILATNRAMLAHLQGIHGATNALKDYGPPVLEFGHEAELKRQQLAQGMSQAQADATL